MAGIRSLGRLLSVLKKAIEERFDYVNENVEVDVTEEQLEWLLSKIKRFQENTPDDDDVEVIIKYVATLTGKVTINGVEVIHYEGERKSIGVGVIT